MKKIDTDVILSVKDTFPIKILSEHKDWFDIFLTNIPFLITVAVVVTTGIVTWKGNKKTIDNNTLISDRQRRQNHENKIAEFRHSWLKDVRETSSHLIRVIHECQSIRMKKNMNLSWRDNAKDIDNERFFQNRLDDFNIQLDIKRSDFYEYYSKLNLLFKQGDPSTENLFLYLDEFKESISNINITNLDDSIIEELQVKNLKGHTP